MADRLATCSREMGVDSVISDSPSAEVDVNHYMDFLAVNPIIHSTKNSVFITHADDAGMVFQTLQMLRYVDAGICMSRMTVKFFLDQGADESKLCYVLPAHDGLIKPRRIKIGLTTHLYPDGRKREELLLRLGKEVGFEDFQFEIYGLRWEETAKIMREFGAVVNLHTGEGNYEKAYQKMLKAIPEFDYYLYMGLDEGSMGTLDALAAAVPLIVAKEGFHMDLGVNPDYGFVTYSELKTAFQQILSIRRKRIESVANLTWHEYARQHVLVWDSLLANPQESFIRKLGQQSVKTENIDGYTPLAGKKKIQYYLKLIQPYRGKMASIFFYYAFKGKIIAQKKRIVRLFFILKQNGIIFLIKYIKSKSF
jgi:hypothetical protein